MVELANPQSHNAMEKTLILFKPDATKRGLVPEISKIFREELGASVPKKWLFAEGDPGLPRLFRDHYKEHESKEWYPDLIRAMATGPIDVGVFEGPPGTIVRAREILERVRAKYGIDRRHNTVHASDSPAAAAREINIWFGDHSATRVWFKKLHPDAVAPDRAHDDDAGFDLRAVTVGRDEYANLVCGTGLAFEIPKGHVGLLFPRSSISKTKLSQRNAVGVIDAGYRGEVVVKFHSQTTGRGESYNPGDKVAQLIVMPIPTVTFDEVADLAPSVRGEGGFGSTGQ